MSNPDNKLLDEIKQSIMGMQNQMQSTYSDLGDIILEGASTDGTVKITMSATYVFQDIEFDEKALEGGVKEFKWRIREAWKNLAESIQKTTQEQTVQLLQGMDIPEDIRNITAEDDKESRE